VNGKLYVLYQMVALPTTLTDPNHLRPPTFITFWSSFISLEWVGL